MELLTRWYSTIPYSADRFNPVKNGSMNKPEGGLWTSPKDSDWGWKDWCEVEMPNWLHKPSYILTLDISNVFVIDSFEIADGCPLWNEREKWKECRPKMGINYETLAKQYSGVWVKPFDRWRFRHTPFDFNTWDCDTVLVFDPSIILNIKQEEVF